MEIMSITEHVTNPRPIFLEAHKQNKSYIAHAIEDGKNESICGCKFICGIYRLDGSSIVVHDFDDPTSSGNTWPKHAIQCPTCLDFYSNNKEKFSNELVQD